MVNFLLSILLKFCCVIMSLEGEGTSQPDPPDQLGLRRKKSIRAGYRAHTRKLLREGNLLINQENPSKTELERVTTVLREKLRILRESDLEIFGLVAENDIENEVIDAEDWQSEIQGNIILLEAKLATDSNAENANLERASTSSGTAGATASNQQPSADVINLPKLFLPKFGGDPKKWQEFWDSFGVVDKNSSIAPVNKLRHLKGLLEGEAAAAISGISTTDANYENAVTILKDRFAQKQIIVNAHIEALMNLRSITNEKDVKGLRKLIDEIDTNIRSLKTLGYDLTQFGPFLNPMIMNKLPDEIRLTVTKLMQGEDWDLKTILENIRAELQAREQCANLKAKVINNLPASRPFNRQQHTTAALMSDSNKITCSFCRNFHLSAKCTVVTDPNQRKGILKKQGRCFVCLKRGHISKECPSRIFCFKCKQRHHTSICDSRQEVNAAARNSSLNSAAQPWQQNNSNNTSQPTPRHVAQPPTAHPSTPAAAQSASQAPSTSTTTLHVNTRDSILLQTAKGYISSTTSTGKVVVARMIMDSGSKHSYISERLRNELNLHTISQDTLTIKVFGEENGTLQTCDIVEFCIRSPYNGLCTYMTAYVVPVICAPLSNQALKFAANNYPHLTGLCLADCLAEAEQKLECEILVGSNHYWNFLSGNCIRGENGPTALESSLGWILSGPVNNGTDADSTEINIVQTHVLKVESEPDEGHAAIDKQLTRFWDLESLGILNDEKSVFNSFEDELSFVNGKYQVKLPWKPEHAALPDNYRLSQKRLENNLSKLQTKPSLLAEYDSIIKEQEKAGIIERVDKSQECETGKTTYLPHHAVVRQNKTTTKVRVVYDASARDRSGTSLNSCLYTGPCLLKTIPEIITRFRLFPLALTADIEKAFLMIAVWPPDRDALRFLWVDNVHAESPETIIYRFTRVVFGVSCSPFLLNATLKKHIETFQEEYPEICNALINSLYADDVNFGGYSETEVWHLYEMSKQIMHDGGFNLRKWLSNSEEIMARINSKESKRKEMKNENPKIAEDDNSFAKTSLSSNETLDRGENKVLGLTWDTKSDNFTFDFAKLTQDALKAPITKRTVLGLIAKFYDPLGLITPIVSPLKVFLQGLFRANLSWDEPLVNELAREWKSLLHQLTEAGKIEIPRYYFGSIKTRPTEIELFGFSDSSERAYSALVYARITVNEHTQTQLVMAKSRVAPLKKLTIPRLELLGALILARLINTVLKALLPFCNAKISKCWSDSITTIFWIKGDQREWKLFVENRVQEIRQLVPKELWEHCPGKDNPADIPTRNNNPTTLNTNSRWFKGPEWLETEQASWPRQPTVTDPPETCLAEAKSSTKNKELTTLLVETRSPQRISNIVNPENYSDYGKLLRVTAYVLKFIDLCRKKTNGSSKDITSVEIDRAEKCWIRDIQSSFTKGKLDELRKTLGIFTDDQGIIRCKGRLEHSSLPYETKHPALLPKEHRITDLLIWDSHRRVLHNGARETLQQLRTRFWVLRARQKVKKVIRTCVLCKRIQGLSYGIPQQSQLPEFRVNEDCAFSVVGIDFAGPLFIRNSPNSSNKVYIALFTCGNSRAVHLELVPDLTTTTFLLCFRRFISRRGMPNIVVTDNAKTFKAFSKTLHRIFKEAETRDFLSENRIRWQFNLAKAPWWGGFYERLVKSVKLCLKKCVKTARLTLDELHTIVIEIEGVLNTRPLTHQYPEDLTTPLTPAHLIMGRRIIQLPVDFGSDMNDRDFNDNDDHIRRRSKHLTKLLKHYWQRWKREYLVNLREQHRLQKGQGNILPPRIGDIVTVENENHKNRSFWKLGRVISLIVGQDDIPRGAQVQLANGQTINRPLQKLYPLEVQSATKKNHPEEEAESTASRPRRHAALMAEERINIVAQLDQGQLN